MDHIESLQAPAERKALHRGGAALILSGALTGILGLVYWIFAARLYGATAVGRNSSLISAMLTISGLAQLNYTRALSSLIPRASPHAGRLVGKVYVAVGVLSLAAGAALAGVLPGLSSRFAYLHPASLAIPGFALAVALWSIFTLEDTVLASARAASMVPIENAVFGVAKLGLLFLFVAVHVGDLAIFISWVLPLVAIVVPINLFAFRRALPRVAHIAVKEITVAGNWVRYDFAGYIFWLLGTSTLPFLVIAALGAKEAGRFYIPLTIATAIDVVSLNVGNAITAEVARNGGVISRQTARFVAAFWALVIVGSITVAILAPTILVVFGKHYRSGSPEVLRLLLAAASARSAMFLTNALARAQGRGGRILLIQSVASVLTLSIGLSTMSHIGTRGMAIGWLVGSVAAGLISLFWFLPQLSGGARRTASSAPVMALRDDRYDGGVSMSAITETVTSPVTVSVVICAYTEDRWPLIVQSVAAARRQTRRPLEIILCIDHNDTLLERCQAYWGQPSEQGDVPVSVIANRYDGHLGSARNSAAELAKGDVIAFVDDDAAADDNWLELLITPYEESDVAAVGGRPLPVFESHRPGWFPTEFDWVFGCAYVGLPTRRAPLGHLIGANMSVRRSVLHEIDGFHSDDHDDMDLSHRVSHLRGHESVVFEPSAIVRHFVPSSRTTWAYFWRRCYKVNKGKVGAFAEMGAAASLSSETTFVRSALLRGVPRSIMSFFKGDASGINRALAIVAGVLLAGIGHLNGQFNLRVAAARRPPFGP